MRTRLKLLRVGRNQNQEEAAKSVGVSRSYYGLIESGRNNGSHKFWNSVQRVYNIPDSEMWEVTKNDED